MLATMATAHRLAIRIEPRRAMKPPPQNEAGMPTANTAHENIESCQTSIWARGATTPGANSASATSA